MKKLFSLIACLALVLVCAAPAAGYTPGEGCRLNLRKWIHSSTRRSYVERMIDYQVQIGRAHV